MQPGINAYANAARTAKTAISPRELEAELLMKAATHLQAVADHWESRADELDAALDFNRKLWTLLASALASPDHPLPARDRQNLLNLANFILAESFRISANASRDSLPALIDINRNIAAGLRGR
jgi:flagellar protein FlaF